MHEIFDAVREGRSGKFSARRLALLVFTTPLSLLYAWQLWQTPVEKPLPDIPRGPIAIVAILSGSAAFQRKQTPPAP